MPKTLVSTQESLAIYFQKFRKEIIGDSATFESVAGKQKLLYMDWIASGRLYEPIENTMRNEIGPWIANTHSFSSQTGKLSTYAYQHARQLIKNHLNAGTDDVLVTCGTGMTGVLARLQRIMGLRWPDMKREKMSLSEEDRPVVFITHMEHHSNQVPWMETIADVVILPSDDEQLVSPANLEASLEKYKHRPMKIGAFSASSNVTGIISPYYDLAKVMHEYGGYCLVDFAASAPYVDIDMRPADEKERLDAVFFSPHKFLGGPGSCGVLVFNKELYNTEVPDVPGGGNVKWTDPWGGFEYHDEIETKEDGGTPGFLQAMRVALSIRLKDEMGVLNIEAREKELLTLAFKELQKIDGLQILGSTAVKRIGCISFNVKDIHYNLLVRLLNDRFGIQVRGGWSCASTYGHMLMAIDRNASKNIMKGIGLKDLSAKPGWVRLSLHPTTTDAEINFVCEAIKKIVSNIKEWSDGYRYNSQSNEFEHVRLGDKEIIAEVSSWFE